eukprot:785477-Amphidinium_carterae.1
MSAPKPEIICRRRNRETCDHPPPGTCAQLPEPGWSPGEKRYKTRYRHIRAQVPKPGCYRQVGK